MKLANFFEKISEVRARRNSSPQPPPSAAPERISGISEIALAISQEMVSSRTVKIHYGKQFEINIQESKD